MAEIGEALGIPGFEEARLIGRGGFGAVFRVRQPKLDREVAIKVLDVVGVDEQLRRRFDREQRVMGALSSHPGIVTLFDTGYTDAGRPYLVMELMTGGSLRDRLDAHGPMPWREAAAVILTITDAVAQAHQQGVLHRDIKPDNILISAFGEAKLTDFGIATLLEGTVTSTTSISATLEYAAPEILAGEIATPAADVYSLAATLYALLAGHSAFSGARDESMLALLNRVLTTNPPDLRAIGVPEPLSALIESCLAKDRTHRPQTATAFADQLRDAVRRAELADPNGPGIPALGAIRISGPVLVVPGHDPGPAPHLAPTEIVPKAPRTTPAPSTPKIRRPTRTGRTIAIAAAIIVFGGAVAGTVLLLADGHGGSTTTATTDAASTTPTTTTTATAADSTTPTTTAPVAPGTGASPLSGVIVFDSDRDGDKDIYTMDLATRAITQLTDDPAYDGMPAWAPDGEEIVFVSNRDGDYEIFYMSADGTGEHQVTFNTSAERRPSWRDGGVLAFEGNASGNWDIYLYDMGASTQWACSTDPADDTEAHFGTQDESILFTSMRSGNGELYRSACEPGDAVNLTDNDAYDGFGMESPDGTSIMFHSDRSGSFLLYLMDPDGSNVRQLSPSGAWEVAAAWSPDGTQAAYLSGSPHEVCILVLASGERTCVTDDEATDEYPSFRPPLRR